MENIRDKLAENIHEMWAMGKIEAGWTHGERRDDTMGLHPCLTQFQNLPQAEKRYNVQLAVQTLRYVLLKLHVFCLHISRISLLFIIFLERS